MKLAESLSPITTNLDETSKKLGDVIKESTQNLGNAIKDNSTPNTQQPIENTPTTQQPKENNEGDVYDVELEKTLHKLKDNTGFFKTHYDPQRGWMLNTYPIKTPGGTNLKVGDNIYDINPVLQKVFSDTKYETAKSMSDTEKVVFKDILSKTKFFNRKLTKGKLSGRDRYIKNDLHNDVTKILNLVKKLRGKEVEKIIIPSNIIDIYTRLEVLLGLKLSGHTDTVTQACNIIDTLSINNNCTNNDKIIEIVTPLITIIPCGMSLICLISLMIYILIKPLITNKR